MAEHSEETVTIELPRQRALRLGCQIIHQAQLARDALEAGNSHAALAHYYRMDTELLGRAFKLAPEDFQQELLAMVADGTNEPGK